VSFDDLEVPDADRVGEEGLGFRYLLDGLNPERILVAAEALGIGRVAIERAVAYANSRIVYGHPIGRNQGIAFPLAEAYARLHAAELVVREASWRYDRGLACGEQAIMAKWLAADAAFQAADQAMQTQSAASATVSERAGRTLQPATTADGGFGYALEYDVSRYWREARLMKIAPIPRRWYLTTSPSTCWAYHAPTVHSDAQDEWTST
jgi:acyl-CoA dehydrogenase